jgi:precorrin-6A/cobalt-precorrin-6A reductase
MILIFSGTVDGRRIGEKLSQNHKVIISVTTDYGEELLSDIDNCEVIRKNMDESDIKALIEEKKVKIIVDATHPYATNIKANIISASKDMNVSVIRYEREETEAEDKLLYDTYEDIISSLQSLEGNILLTIGSKNVHLFSSLIEDKRVFARVLPVEKSIMECRQAGLSPDRIIALQGPFSKAFNDLIIKEKQIKHLVTKESSKVGGVREKIASANQAGIAIYILKRPESAYEIVFDDYDELVGCVEKMLKE